MTIEDGTLGTFLLEREYSWFVGTADWRGTKCNVYLITAEKAYAHFQTLYRDREVWDDKFRQFSADELLELANDWYEYSDDDFDVEMPIQRDEFLRRLSIASIEVYEEGSITVYYDADEMFTDHAIVIYAKIDGTISSADIIG